MVRTPQQPAASSRRWITGVMLATTLSSIGMTAQPGLTSAHEQAIGEMTHVNPAGLHRTVGAGGANETDNPFFRNCTDDKLDFRIGGLAQDDAMTIDRLTGRRRLLDQFDDARHFSAALFALPMDIIHVRAVQV